MNYQEVGALQYLAGYVVKKIKLKELNQSRFKKWIILQLREIMNIN